MEVGKIHRNWKEKMIFMSCFLRGWSKEVKRIFATPQGTYSIWLKFRVNILLQHWVLYTTDFQHLAVEFFEVKILAEAVLFGGA